MRKEKHITERETKKGSKYLQIQIRYKDGSGTESRFSQSVMLADFATPSQAMKCAVQIRDQALADIKNNTTLSKMPKVSLLYERKFELFPCSAKTRKKHDIFYKSGIKQYEHMDLDKVTPAMIQKSLNDYAETHTQQQCTHFMAVWKQIYKTAQMEGHNINDKTMMVKMPKSKVLPKQKEVIISRNDFDAFMDVLWHYNRNAHASRMIWYMLQIMYHTGCRPAEALAIGREQINGNLLVINRAVGSDKENTRMLIPTKTITSIRTVPIDAELMPIIQELLNESHSDPLLADKAGKPFEIDYVSNYIHLVSQKCGIKFNSYMLRHTFAKDVMKDNSPRVVQDLLGHSSFSTSLMYSRSDDAEKEKAIQKRLS